MSGDAPVNGVRLMLAHYRTGDAARGGQRCPEPSFIQRAESLAMELVAFAAALLAARLQAA